MSCITLGVTDLARTRRFYAEGFGWKPVFEQADILFFQMNGLMLGTWLKSALEEDMGVKASPAPGAFNIAHNVPRADDVQKVLDQLAKHGGRIMRNADAPPHGGKRGYVADPDGHIWEIAYNPTWPISPEGYVKFGS